MHQALITMLNMQDHMNSKVHPEWQKQGWPWYRAIWLECGELMDHYGYKWWKSQEPDMAQVRLEIVDIWHFGLSDLYQAEFTAEEVANTIIEQVEQISQPRKALALRDAIENLVANLLISKRFSVADFWVLLTAAEMDFDVLFRDYVGKNVLNVFRQDHGYKEGTYIKQWAGREDNEHLVELMEEMDLVSEKVESVLYDKLSRRYSDSL